MQAERRDRLVQIAMGSLIVTVAVAVCCYIIVMSVNVVLDQQEEVMAEIRREDMQVMRDSFIELMDFVNDYCR